MNIDHIIPERVLLNPASEEEFDDWKKKYDLEDDFDINGYENLVCACGECNLKKSDNGLFDSTHDYDGWIRKALPTAHHLKPAILKKIDEIKNQRKKSFTVNKIESDLEKGFLLPRDIKSSKEISKIFDPVFEELETYEEFKRIWEKPEQIHYYNYREFIEIVNSIRYMEYNVDLLKRDGEFWLDLVEKFSDSIFNREVFYEKMFLLFKMERSWVSFEQELLEYFRSSLDEVVLTELARICRLFQVYSGEFIRGRVEVDKKKYLELRASLIKKIEKEYEESKTDERRSYLLFLKSCLVPTYNGTEEFHKVNPFEDSFSILLKSLEIAPASFDILMINNMIEKIIERLPDAKNSSNYSVLREIIAEKLAEYEKNKSLGQSYGDEGNKLYKEKRFIKALPYFWKSFFHFYNVGAPRKCLLSLLYCIYCFENEKLWCAARYDSLLLLYLAKELEDTEMFVEAFDQLCVIEYEMGEWGRYLYLFERSIAAREMFKENDFIENETNFWELYNNIYNTLLRIKEWFPTKYSIGENLVGSHPLIMNILDKIRDEKVVLGIQHDDDEDSRFICSPFKDIESVRELSINQKQIFWSFRWKNDYENSLVAEEFIGAFQIVLTILNNEAILPLKEKVEVLIERSDNGDDSIIVEKNDNSFIIKMPCETEININMNYITRILIAVCNLLERTSIMHEKSFKDALDFVLKSQWINPVSYSYIYNFFFGNTFFKIIQGSGDRGDQ